MTTTPEDTSKRDPFIHLMGSMSEGASGYITGMEAQGQQQLVHSSVLPIDGHQSLVDLGFTFGETKDDLFIEATFPEGWTREGSDHAMWSYVLDDRGLRRVAVFYKAAFYDRGAHCYPLQVGQDLISKLIYGADDKPDFEIPWDVLTEDEREEMREAVAQYRERFESPYFDETPTMRRRLDEVDAVLKSAEV